MGSGKHDGNRKRLEKLKDLGDDVLEALQKDKERAGELICGEHGPLTVVQYARDAIPEALAKCPLPETLWRKEILPSWREVVSWVERYLRYKLGRHTLFGAVDISQGSDVYTAYIQWKLNGVYLFESRFTGQVSWEQDYWVTAASVSSGNTITYNSSAVSTSNVAMTSGSSSCVITFDDDYFLD